MKSMCKHWGLHISTNINLLGAVLGSFWAVWRGLLWCLKAKLRSWQFPRYWRFNKWYHGSYQLICLISRQYWSLRDVTGIDRKVFWRALSSLWDRGNRRRIGEDMAEWSLWHIHNIIVITNSIAAARKILESKVNPLQNMFIPLASTAKTFLSKDGRNKIHF